MKTAWAIGLVAFGFTGCAASAPPAPPQEPSPEKRIAAECSGSAYIPNAKPATAKEAICYEALSRYAKPPSADLLDKTLLPTDPKAIKGASVGGGAPWLLKNEVILDANVAQTVGEHGLPDAVQLNDNRAFVMYYRKPSGTFIFHNGQMLSFPEVPRSVRVLTFKEQPSATPWPVTLNAQGRALLEVPQPTPSPSEKIERDKFPSDSEYIRKQLVPSNDTTAQNRTVSALARLAPGAPVEGVQWQVVVFKSPQNAFAVPDGTLFVSDGLVNSVDDQQLIAVIAHLMGHVGYGHYRGEHQVKYKEGGELSAGDIAAIPLVTPLAPVAFLTGVLLAAASSASGQGEAGVGVVVPHWPGTGGPKAVMVVDKRSEEVEANNAATQYLARCGIPAAVLFNTMAELRFASSSNGITPRDDSWLDYASMQDHADNGAADLGRMLDAGLIPSR